MRLLFFLNDYARDAAFRADFRSAVDAVQRIRLLRDRFGLNDREIGAVLREDRLEVLQLVNLEVSSFDFGVLRVPTRAPTGVVDEDEEDQGICWPGPVALALDGCFPAEVTPDVEHDLLLTGFHVAQLASIHFVKGERRVLGHLHGVETDAVSGRSWLKVRVKLPEAGAWMAELTNLAGTWQMTTRLPEAVVVA